MALQQQEPKKIYVWVEERIREYTRYTPTSTTLLYLPLETTHTYTDQSNSHKTMTNSGVQFGTYSDVDCSYFNGSSYMELPNVGSGTNFTISFWIRVTGTSTGYIFGSGRNQYQSGRNKGFYYNIWTYGTGTSINFPYMVTDNSTSSWSASIPTGWFHYTLVKSGTTIQGYINGDKKADVSTHSGSPLYDGYLRSVDKLFMLGGYNGSTSSSGFQPSTLFTGYLSEFIIDNTARTAAQVLTKYNNMKEYFYIFN